MRNRRKIVTIGVDAEMSEHAMLQLDDSMKISPSAQCVLPPSIDLIVKRREGKEGGFRFPKCFSNQ